MKIADVKRVAIYPSIGIARVGNSPDEYFLGSTVPGKPATDPDDFRDKKGRIKRQGVKFFVFGLDAKGKILGELNTSNGVKIDWRVEVANKKAAWYDFNLALDIPAAMGDYNSDGEATPGGPPLESKRRNAEFTGEDRQLLIIDGGAQRISGRNKNPKGTTHHFDGTIGKDKIPVYLGEVRTDGQGRLIFLGGRGKSDSFNGMPLKTFANNQGWHDDTSDGPVDATVTLPNGRKLEAEGAWVLTAPPNYAVGVQAFTTGFELLQDVASRSTGEKSGKPAFYKDIYPTLKNLTSNQWVNAGISRDFGWGSAYEFDNEVVVKKLKDKCSKNRPFRQTILESFRNPNFKKMQSAAWPPLYGDAVVIADTSEDPREWYAVTKLQYTNIKKWAQGDFIVDKPRKPKHWKKMSPDEQANGLTEAALEETIGGPFHPGCEFTWPMRHKMMFKKNAPFRIKRRKTPKEDYGVTIDSKKALAKGGPLDGSSPGDLTRWMAVPWQADTSSCLSAYSSYAGEYLPTFWPARVPNDVLTKESYELIKNSKVSKEKKIEAFSPSSRKKWLRGYIYDNQGNFLPNDQNAGITKFTEQWFMIGIALKKRLRTDPNLFPREVWVETGRHVEEPRKEAVEELQAAGKAKRPAWVGMNPRDLR